MYDTTRHELYWPHMAKNVYTTVGDCLAYAMSRFWPQEKPPPETVPRQRAFEIRRNGHSGPPARENIWDPVHCRNNGSKYQRNSCSPLIKNHCATVWLLVVFKRTSFSDFLFSLCFCLQLMHGRLAHVACHLMFL